MHRTHTHIQILTSRTYTRLHSHSRSLCTHNGTLPPFTPRQLTHTQRRITQANITVTTAVSSGRHGHTHAAPHSPNAHSGRHTLSHALAQPHTRTQRYQQRRHTHAHTTKRRGRQARGEGEREARSEPRSSLANRGECTPRGQRHGKAPTRAHRHPQQSADTHTGTRGGGDCTCAKESSRYQYGMRLAAVPACARQRTVTTQAAHTHTPAP